MSACCFPMRPRTTAYRAAASQPLPYSISRKTDSASRATGNALSGLSSSKCTSAITHNSNASCFLMPSSRKAASASRNLACASGSLRSRMWAMASPCAARAPPALSPTFLKRSPARAALSSTPSASSRRAWTRASSRSAIAAILSSAASLNRSSALCACDSASANCEDFSRLRSHAHSAKQSNMAAWPRLSPALSKDASSCRARRSASSGPASS
mmetsp:Transcript_16403/g.48907  ORF Transcript_16403/g.48907 Transcript_16403/m.48907 type:complete len:214 (+) Transcript_16403:1593-2234(+)